MEKLEIPTLNHHIGSTERVFVAHVNDLNDFYLHSESFREPLGKLGQDLYNEYSDSLTKPFQQNEIVNVGDYCACPSESEDWYRGLIRQIDSNGNASVFKLDYGDVQCIPLQFLRPLQKRFFALHRLAFHCSLVNLIKPMDGWPIDIIDEFRSRLTTTFLFAKLVNYNEIRDILEVEITEKNSKISLNKDFEHYQLQRSAIQVHDKLIYKSISMEKLDLNQLYQIRILYYISPSHFYVYLKEKFIAHTTFQVDLQQAMRNLRILSSPVKYHMVATQDNHAIWHRAIITDLDPTRSRICVFFIDIGYHEYTSIHNLRSLPEEFQRKPAFAIPCRLFNISPLNFNEQAIWASDDPVHDEINRLMTNNEMCKICEKHDQICYDIEIDIPKVGDLGAFLCQKNLVIRTKMNSSQRPSFTPGQPTQPSFIRNQLASAGMSLTRPSLQQQQQRSIQQFTSTNNSNNNIQRPEPRSFNPVSQTVTVQNSPIRSANTSSSTNIPMIQPQDGNYLIIQVHSAVEFYGLSQGREKEFTAFSEHMEQFYNSSTNDQSFNVNPTSEGEMYIIQQDNKYHRVTIKRLENGTRISVKLIDRGDEIIVDKSELLKPDKGYLSVPAFAQPFRLEGYSEIQSSTNITRNLKRMILNQSVHIQPTGRNTAGFHHVQVFLHDNQCVNQTLLSGDKNITPPTAHTKPNPNPTQYAPIESLVFSNSHKYPSTTGSNTSGGRLNMGQRTDNVLLPPQKLLTASTRPTLGRFGGGDNQGTSAPSSSMEQTPRFSNASTRNLQQSYTIESSASKQTWNNDQNARPNFGHNNNNNNMTNQQPFNRQQSGSSQFGNNQRPDDNKTFPSNNQSRFPSSAHEYQSSSFEQKRSTGNTQMYDDNNGKQTSGNSFHQRNENNSQRGGFSNRGGSGFADRGGHSGFNNRNLDRSNENNNNENSSHSSGGFNRGRGFASRGSRDGFTDNSSSRSQNFNSSRGERNDNEFQNRRFQGSNTGSGDFERRGGFNDRGGRGQRGGNSGGGRGGRGGFRDRDNNGVQLSSDNNFSTNTNSSWSTMRSNNTNFEAGDRFITTEIPRETFEFVISHIETPNNFFIQLVSKADKISQLTEALQIDFKQSPETNLSSFKVGQACLARSTDQCWYRAVVLSTSLSQVKVRFIDFGDTTDVDSKTIRQIAKNNCVDAPFAYQCTFKNAEANKNTKTEVIVENCGGKQYNGKIEGKNADGIYLLESNDFRKMLLDINAIKLKSEVILKRIKCSIVHIENEKQRFYIQDDEKTVEEISQLVQQEDESAPILSLDEVKELKPDAIVIAEYSDEPFRAIIQSDASEDDVNVCFIDFGNVSSCPKTLLKRCSEKLSSYKHQNKECQLYGVSSDKITEAFQQLENISDSETVEIAIVNQQDQLYNVVVYDNNKCFNEKFGYDPNAEINERPSATNVEEQTPTIVEKQTTDDIIPANEKAVDLFEATTSEKTEIEPEIEEIPSKYRQGVLTHIEQSKPYVYLQLIPESDDIMDQIATLIEKITSEDQHKSSYEIGDHVIAQFSVDDNFYRARIESHSSSTDLYTVYFLDYGNIDDNVVTKHLYAYSDELEHIEPQAHGYILEGVTLDSWHNTVRSLVTDKENEIVEFYIVDEKASIVHMKLDNENDVYNNQESTEQTDLLTVEIGTTVTANISATDKDCFYIHVLPSGNLHVCEMEEHLLSCEKLHKEQWSINDLCIVSNEDNKLYRGQILSTNDEKYNVKCIDYGHILSNINDEQLFVLPDEDIYQQFPLAHQCRLYEIDGVNQIKAIEDTIKHIPETEHVTIIVENKSDDQCLLVTLVRENREIINNQYLTNEENETKQESDNIEKDEQVLPTSSVTIPVADVQSDNTHEQSTLDEKVPQIESTIEENSSVSTSNNQAIEESTENNQSTTKDETQPSSSSD